MAETTRRVLSLPMGRLLALAGPKKVNMLYVLRKSLGRGTPGWGNG
jgi:hypothetical protein